MPVKSSAYVGTVLVYPSQFEENTSGVPFWDTHICGFLLGSPAPIDVMTGETYGVLRVFGILKDLLLLFLPLMILPRHIMRSLCERNTCSSFGGENEVTWKNFLMWTSTAFPLQHWIAKYRRE